MFNKTIKDSQEYFNQKAALQYFQVPHMVKLLKFDDAQQSLTLEYISNHSLKDLFPREDERATKLACEVIDALHATTNKTDFPFPDLAEWCKTLQKAHPLPADLLNLASKKAKRLLANTSRKVLLHGDLHHANILLKEGRPIAIDPKAVWGDPLFEPARFILNPIDLMLKEPDVAEILQRRIADFSKYFHDQENRIRDWTFVCAMIAACWNDEDGFDPTPWVRLANLIDTYRANFNPTCEDLNPKDS